MNGQHKTARRRNPRGGFTLLEMIAVIGIIAIMATVVVGGYAGMVTAVGESSAAQTVERAINLARQEAAVDGADTYFVVIDIDRFCLVRKAGTITDTDTGEQSWGVFGTRIRPDKWIVDDYADLAHRQQAGDSVTNAVDAAKDYDGDLVFDISKGAMARVKTATTWVGDKDAWVFGIDDLASGSAAKFAVGDEYGWVTHPVYALPEGWVFAGSYTKSGTDAGAFNWKEVKIHFTSGGEVADEKTIDFENPSKNRTFSIRVDNSGVERVNNTGS